MFAHLLPDREVTDAHRPSHGSSSIVSFGSNFYSHRGTFQISPNDSFPNVTGGISTRDGSFWFLWALGHKYRLCVPERVLLSLSHVSTPI